MENNAIDQEDSETDIENSTEISLKRYNATVCSQSKKKNPTNKSELTMTAMMTPPSPEPM